MIKSRKIWYGLVLLGIVGAVAIVIWHFHLGPPWGVTEEDVMREGARDGVLTRKMYECQDGGAWWSEDDPRKIAMEKLQQIYEQYFREADEGKVPSLKEEYLFWVKINRIREKALIQIMGKKDFQAFIS